MSEVRTANKRLSFKKTVLFLEIEYSRFYKSIEAASLWCCSVPRYALYEAQQCICVRPLSRKLESTFQYSVMHVMHITVSDQFLIVSADRGRSTVPTLNLYSISKSYHQWLRMLCALKRMKKPSTQRVKSRLCSSVILSLQNINIT